MLANRCIHALRFFVENGYPVVVYKEHDREELPWLGNPRGRGWRIFLRDAVVPKLADAPDEPREPYKEFEEVEAKVRPMMDEWERFRDMAQLGGDMTWAQTRRMHYARAVQWWREFLDGHKEAFRDGKKSVTGEEAKRLLPPLDSPLVLPPLQPMRVDCRSR